MEKIIQATLTRLRDEFIGRLPGRVAALEPLLDAVSKGEREAVEQLNREAHSLVGVAGTYRLMPVYEAARKLEVVVASLPADKKPGAAKLRDLREALANLALLAKQPIHSTVPFAEKQQASQRIVVVDDDVEQSNWMRSVLEQAGFQVEVFNELSIFRNACQTRQDMPAAVIMDMMFPEGDDAGARTVAEMRAKCLKRLPVIFISAREDMAAKLAAYRAGATRYLTKPLQREALLQAVNESASLIPSEPYRVLLVDDDIDQLAIHALMLRNAGIEVREISNPLLVEKMLDEFPAEALLLDMYMPECTGTELAAILRDDVRHAEIPVIYLSVEADISRQLLALDRAGDHFLTKPVNPDHLVAVLEMHARRFRQNHEQSEILRSTLYERERQQQAVDAHAIVSATDASGNLTFVNDKFCEISGYSREELIGVNHRIVNSGQHTPEYFADMWRRIKSGQIWHGEICNKSKDGRLYWVNTSIVPFLDEQGKPYQYISIRTDITDIKQHEAEMRMVLDNAADAVFIAGKNERWVYVNDQTVSMLGYSREELLSMSIYELVPADWRETYRQNFREKLHVDGALHQEIRLVKKDGEKIAVEMNAAVLPDGRVYGSCRDISRRKEAEAALKKASEKLLESEARFRNMADQAPALIWLADTQNLGTWYNKRWLAYTGRSMEQELGLGWADGMHPDDLDKSVQCCSEAFNARRTFEMEFRLRRGDGSYGWIADTGIPRFNDKGEFEGYIGYCWDITERKQAETERQEALDRLQKISSRVPGMVYQFRMRPDGSTQFPYASDSVKNILGVSWEDIREDGAKAFEVVHPDDVAELIASTQASAQNLTLWRHQFRVRWGDGTVRWLFGETTPEREADGSVLWHGFITDITERKQDELILAESRARLESAQAQAHLGNWDSDMTTGEAQWSAETFRIFGHDPASFKASGKAFFDAVHPEDREMVMRNGNEAARSGVFDFVHRIIRPDGEVRFVHQLAKVQTDSAGQLTTLRGTVQDITELKLAEQALIAAKNEAESASRAKSEFLASMSHELRTPLNAILGFSQLFAMNTQLPAETRDNAQEIERAGQHLLSLVNDMIDLARIESGKLELSLEPVPVRTVVKDSLAMVASLASAQRIETIEEGCSEDEITVRADYVRLRQVTINLLTNAVKYNKPQGSVKVSCRISENQVRISVADTGIGIPADKQSRVFNSFDRLGEERGTIEGTGIGLVITKRIVEAMGGSIGFESVEGQGSTFWITMPLTEANHTHALANLAEKAPDGQNSGSIAGHTEMSAVLYIEDNPMNMRLMQQIFASQKHLQLREAHTAEIGIKMAYDNPPALILMDINLPGMDGYKALTFLKADERTAHIPVIAISANAMMGDKERGLAAGFADYLTKPLDVDRLLRTVERYT